MLVILVIFVIGHFVILVIFEVFLRNSYLPLPDLWWWSLLVGVESQRVVGCRSLSCRPLPLPARSLRSDVEWSSGLVVVKPMGILLVIRLVIRLVIQGVIPLARSCWWRRGRCDIWLVHGRSDRSYFFYIFGPKPRLLRLANSPVRTQVERWRSSWNFWLLRRTPQNYLAVVAPSLTRWIRYRLTKWGLCCADDLAQTNKNLCQICEETKRWIVQLIFLTHKPGSNFPYFTYWMSYLSTRGDPLLSSDGREIHSVHFKLFRKTPHGHLREFENFLEFSEEIGRFIQPRSLSFDERS